MRHRFTICLPVVFAALLVVGLSACSETGATTTASATATSTPVTPSATTPHGPPVTAATLGGPVDAFYAKYGVEADNLFDVNGVTFSLNDDTGSDGKPHDFEMLVYPSDAHVWTMEQAKPICTAFLPPDAKFARSITSSDGNLEDVYTSPEATASFAPSSPWYTADGSVSIRYERPLNGGSGVFQCSPSLGI